MKFKLPIILFLYFVLVIFALLEPFDFDFYSNNAKWLQVKNGIRFEQNGMIISKESTARLCQKLTEGDGLTLEVWINTYNILQDGPARIFSYSIDHSLPNFTLAQSKDKLIMRLRTELTDLNGVIPQIEVAEVFEANKIYHIVVSYNFDNECIFINGKKRVCDSSVRGKFSNWDPSFKLIIGNEVTGQRPWLGEIYYAAIYGMALNRREVKLKYKTGSSDTTGSHLNQVANGTIPVICYLFNEKKGNKVTDTAISPHKFNLYIPDKSPARRPFLKVPALKGFHTKIFTIWNFLNIIGFIPLGFLLHRLIKLKLFRFKTVSVVLLIGLSISLGCEVMQHFLPSRHSSIIDVFTNMFGLSIGLTIDKLF